MSNHVTGIEAGQHTIILSRYGYRSCPPMELDFRSLTPVRLPKFEWKRPRTKVTINSTPPGASVWMGGKELGKKTPCTIEDVDDGPVNGFPCPVMPRPRCGAKW